MQSDEQEPGLVEDQNHFEPSGKGNLRSWLRDLVISIAVSAFIIIFLYQPVRVE